MRSRRKAIAGQYEEWYDVIGPFAIVRLASVAVGYAQTRTSSAGIQVNPAQVQQKAVSPPRSDDSSTTSSIGQRVQKATPADSWVEQLDVDGKAPPNKAT